MMIRTVDVQEFFFEAMMLSLQGEIPVTPVFDMPGFSQLEFHKKGWRCLQRWQVSQPINNPESTRLISAGAIVIWHEDRHLWSMNYSGYYEKEVAEFMELAVNENIKNKVFYGGRGPKKFELVNQPFIYQNSIHQRDCGFQYFRGRETVHSVTTDEMLGCHQYFGQSYL